jgi:hypothetical protein
MYKDTASVTKFTAGMGNLDKGLGILSGSHHGGNHGLDQDFTFLFE